MPKCSLLNIQNIPQIWTKSSSIWYQSLFWTNPGVLWSRFTLRQSTQQIQRWVSESHSIKSNNLIDFQWKPSISCFSPFYSWIWLLRDGGTSQHWCETHLSGWRGVYVSLGVHRTWGWDWFCCLRICWVHRRTSSLFGQETSRCVSRPSRGSGDGWHDRWGVHATGRSQREVESVDSWRVDLSWIHCHSAGKTQM